MLSRCTAAALIAASFSLSPAAAHAATPQQITAAEQAAVSWIKTLQEPSTGSLGNAGEWLASGLAAAGRHPADVRVGGGPSLQDALAAQYTGADYTGAISAVLPTDGALNQFSKAILFGAPSGLDPQRLGGGQVNHVARLAAGFRPATGGFGSGATNVSAFATMALARAGAPQPLLARAAQYLRLQQHDDGGFAFGRVTTDAQRAAAGDADITGAALAAICGTGATTLDPVVQRGVAFLQTKLVASGGIDSPGIGANADTTGWAVSGLNACGVDPQSAGFTAAGGATPIDFLLTLQFGAGGNAGAFKWRPVDVGPTQNATHDALRALAGAAFTAATPQRANMADPRMRAFVAPPVGTVTPHALVVDDGSGVPQFCRVDVGVGVTLAALLDQARVASAPAGCVSDEVRARAAEQLGGALAAPVGFGDTVLVQLTGGVAPPVVTSSTLVVPPPPPGTTESAATPSTGDVPVPVTPTVPVVQAAAKAPVCSVRARRISCKGLVVTAGKAELLRRGKRVALVAARRVTVRKGVKLVAGTYVLRTLPRSGKPVSRTITLR